jgi:hypothetical protein
MKSFSAYRQGGDFARFFALSGDFVCLFDRALSVLCRIGNGPIRKLIPAVPKVRYLECGSDRSPIHQVCPLFSRILNVFW